MLMTHEDEALEVQREFMRREKCPGLAGFKERTKNKRGLFFKYLRPQLNLLAWAASSFTWVKRTGERDETGWGNR